MSFLEITIHDLSEELQTNITNQPITLTENNLVVYKDKLAVDVQKHEIPANPQNTHLGRKLRNKYQNAITNHFLKLNEQFNNQQPQGFFAQLLNKPPTQKQLYTQLDTLVRNHAAASHITKHFNQETDFYHTIHEDMKGLLRHVQAKTPQIQENIHLLGEIPTTYQQLQDKLQQTHTNNTPYSLLNPRTHLKLG